MIEPSVLSDALDRVVDAPYSLVGPKCTVARILQTLALTDPAALQKLLAALDNPSVQASRIAQALLDNGFDVDGARIRRHRSRGTARGCKCPK